MALIMMTRELIWDEVYLDLYIKNQFVIDLCFVECPDCFSIIPRMYICEYCLINGTGCEQQLGIIKAF